MPRFLCLVCCLLVPPLVGQAAPPSSEALTRLVRRAGSPVHWIADPFERADFASRRAPPPYVPPVDRNALLDGALRRAQAEQRMVLVYVWHIEGQPMYRAPLLDDYMNLAIFSDPELAELVNRKFVPVRLYADSSVARRLDMFNASQSDALYLAALEPALVVLSPDGKIVHRVERIRTFSVHWIRHVLEQVLRRNPTWNAPSLTTGAVAAALKDNDVPALVYLAHEQCLDGDERKALATLEQAAAQQTDEISKREAELAALEARKPADAESREYRVWTFSIRGVRSRLEAARRGTLAYHLTKAMAHRLLRDGDAALACVQQALAQLADAASGEPSLWLEEARIHLALGNVTEAEKSLAGAGESSEAEYLRGLCPWLRHDADAAIPHFQQAVALGEGPFAWRAAAVLASADDTTPFSPLAHGFEMVRYGPAAAYEVALPTTTELPRPDSPAAARDRIARAAFEFLLRQQRPDGSWPDARYVWSGVDILPNVHVAVTALAASALLAWRDIDAARVDAALARAEPYLRDDRCLSLGNEEEVYSQAYRMLYWTRKAAGGFGTRAELFANMEAIVRRAAEIQDKSTGFFAHEYPNAFCTGAMLWSLYLARTVGVQFDEDVIHLGVKALLAARRDDGSFAYGGSAAQRDQRRPGRASITQLKDASARMPLCETVLHAFGSSDPDKVAAAFRTFLEHLDRIARVRKADFHSDGELAGFFFWHAIFHATEAKNLLDDELRVQVEKRLLDLVTSFPEIDGSFVDSHELGKSYGTAMALLCLRNLPKAE